MKNFSRDGNTTDTIGDKELVALAELSSDHLLLLVDLETTLSIKKAVSIQTSHCSAKKKKNSIDSSNTSLNCT